MNPSLPITSELLNQRLQKTFGSKTSLTGWKALTGGTRKKVFRLELAQPNQPVVLMTWQNEHDYFSERDNAHSINSDQQAPLLYQANTQLLIRAGVNVPALYDFDSSCSEAAFSFALVEYCEGKSFNEWREGRAAHEVQTVLAKFREQLHKMHAIQRDEYGTMLDETHKTSPYYETVFNDTLVELSVLACAFEKVGQNEDRVRKKMEALYQQISSRNRYCIIHGELGPDEHLIINQHGNVWMIDLDGCQFLDAEREYAYLKLRFDRYYESLKRNDLDETRMQFYGLCLHISAAHGHYQLYRQGFPDPDMLRLIYESNIEKMLRITDTA